MIYQAIKLYQDSPGGVCKGGVTTHPYCDVTCMEVNGDLEGGLTMMDSEPWVVHVGD